MISSGCLRLQNIERQSVIVRLLPSAPRDVAGRGFDQRKISIEDLQHVEGEVASLFLRNSETEGGFTTTHGKSHSERFPLIVKAAERTRNTTYFSQSYSRGIDKKNQGS